MFKQNLFSKVLLLMLLFIGVHASVFADEQTVTYTFTDKAWSTSEEVWTSGKDGAGFSNGGVQVTTKATGANATSNESFSNVSKIVVTYATNKSQGTGSVELKIGENTAVSNSVSYPGTGEGNKQNYTTQFDYSTPQSGNIKLTVYCTTNSIYVKSIAITYDDGVAAKTPIATIGDLEPTTLEVNDDGTFTLPIEYATDDPTDYEVVWSSDNEDVLYVFQEDGVECGQYLTFEAGTANVTVTVTPVDDETYHEVSKTFAIEVKEPIIEVTTMDIDFEYPLESYINWEFVNVSTNATGIEAHGGSKFGSNKNDSGSGGVANCSMTTNNTVANPGTLKFYISKTSNNTTEANWFVEVSEDGEEWTEVVSYNAKIMSKGQWLEKTTDLSSYSNVYIRIRYGQNTAIVAIDDITLTENEAPAAVAVEIGAAGAATFSSAEALDFTDVTTVAAYIAKEATSGNSALEFTRVYKVPANTGLIVRNAAGEDDGAVSADVPVLAGEADNVEGNLFVAAIDEIASLPSEDGEYTNYILNKKNGVLGFYKANGKKVAAGKAYLKMHTGSGAAEFIGFDGEVTAIESLTADKADNEIFDLQGRRVAKAAKGVYIVNGKKVVLK